MEYKEGSTEQVVIVFKKGIKTGQIVMKVG